MSDEAAVFGAIELRCERIRLGSRIEVCDIHCQTQ